MIAALSLAVPGGPAAAQTARQTAELTDGLSYLLYLPEGHDPSRRWPLILFLHGFGERSSQNADGEPFSALTVHSMPSVVESEDWDWPFIVVSPQIDDEGWLTRADDLAALTDRMVEERGADPNRLYLTGLSYGGRGTWQVGLRQLDRWAALMPLCSDPSGLDADDRAQLSTRPLFVVHGTADPTDNDYATLASFIDSFANEGTPFYRFDYAWRDQERDLFPPEAVAERHVFAHMEAYGHDVWTATYGRRDGDPKTVTYEWLLSQSLDGSAFIDPRDPNYDALVAERDGSGDQSGCAVAPAPASGAAERWLTLLAALLLPRWRRRRRA